MAGEEVYSRLREHLHKLPGGFLATKERYEIIKSTVAPGQY